MSRGWRYPLTVVIRPSERKVGEGGARMINAMRNGKRPCGDQRFEKGLHDDLYHHRYLN